MPPNWPAFQHQHRQPLQQAVTAAAKPAAPPPMTITSSSSCRRSCACGMAPINLAHQPHLRQRHFRPGLYFATTGGGESEQRRHHRGGDNVGHMSGAVERIQKRLR